MRPDPRGVHPPQVVRVDGVILAADPRLAAVADAIMAAAKSDGEDMATQAGDVPVIEPAPAPADPAMQGAPL